jgi:phosphatidylglycerol---prolipoprotein diacylglyceryl transferase
VRLAKKISFSHVHPVLFHIGSLIVPSHGVLTALGLLLALVLLLPTARIAGADPNQLWNLAILAFLAALAGSRLLLVALNWTVVRSHPAWLLDLAMIHHPLLTGAGTLCALAVAIPYIRLRRLPPRNTADALAPPILLGAACEQWGALLSGSGYGTEADVRWAVTYTQPLAARWSGTPLFVPLHPVQAYAAIAFLLLAIALLLCLPHRPQPGDIGGLGLMAAGTAVFFTEFWRDSAGRGAIFQGAIDFPQVAAVALVFAGACMLRDRKHPQPSANSASTLEPTDERPA